MSRFGDDDDRPMDSEPPLPAIKDCKHLAEQTQILANVSPSQSGS